MALLTPPSPEALSVTGLSTAFGDHIVLSGVELQVAMGETLVILGRSGTGKSVLLRHLIGLQKPDAGTVQVLGRDLGTLGEDALNDLRKEVGFVFQNAALYDSLTVAGNVEFPLRHHTTLTAPERRAKAMAILSWFALEGAAEQFPAELSGGMRKRVGMARALALEPKVMLYDEPTAGLDPITAGEISRLIRKLQVDRGISAIVVTHDLLSAALVSDRVALLDHGKIVFLGSFAELETCDDPLAVLFIHEGLSSGRALP